MPKVTFIKDFDYRVKPGSAAGSVVAYKKGWSGSIPQAHIDAAAEAGAIDKAAVKETADAGRGKAD